MRKAGNPFDTSRKYGRVLPAVLVDYQIGSILKIEPIFGGSFEINFQSGRWKMEFYGREEI